MVRFLTGYFIAVESYATMGYEDMLVGPVETTGSITGSTSVGTDAHFIDVDAYFLPRED